MKIVEAKVKPDRMKKDQKKYPRMVLEWWKFWNSRPGLFFAISRKSRVLANSMVGDHLSFAWLPPAGLAEKLAVFPRTAMPSCSDAIACPRSLGALLLIVDER
nr:hypothetical protein [Deltaproteobacteria bacterium]